MSQLRFSVVVPTRERVATLRHCLATCLDQQFDNYEVIVSDNGTSEATQELVQEISSPRIRYVRTPASLSMASNWEFGVSHAQGEYVLIVGDDDGLLPHSLRELDSLIQQTGHKAIRWDASYYTWPSFALAGQGDFLRLPLGRSLVEVDSMEMIRQVIEFRDFYSSLPMIYNSAVHRDILAEIRAKTGRIFVHSIPDVYSGFAVAAVSGRYLSSDVPMSISGQSGASNGIATLFRRGKTPIDKDFKDLNDREQLLPDPRTPDLPSFPYIPLADAFYAAKRNFFPEATIDIDRKQLVTGCIANLRVANEAEWSEALTILRESLADVPDVQDWFDRALANTPYRNVPFQVRPTALGLEGEVLNLDAAAFGVKDVSGAAKLCENVLNYAKHGVVYLKEELASVKGITRSVLAVIEAQRMEIQQLRTRSQRTALSRIRNKIRSLLN